MQHQEDLLEFDPCHDSRIRTAVFEWLNRQVSVYGDVLSRGILTEGFEFGSQRVRLVGPQGIFKPALMQAPISITSIPSGPYDDGFGSDNLLRYRYRGTDPRHRDNVGLRFLMRNEIPLVYFHRVIRGKYLATWPVYVVFDSPDTLTFSIAVDNNVGFGKSSQFPRSSDDIADIRREYVTTTTRHRLHQRVFRERVLQAYFHQCAFCRLRHIELLDAAHIVPDSEPEGEPVVSNGLSLCRLHHAAFDRFFLGVRPDLTIEVRPDVLEEADGPTLQHAIQGLHGLSIMLPRKAEDQPSIDLLSQRYERFMDIVAAI